MSTTTSLTEQDASQQLHKRAEEILTPLLATQGRMPNSYTSDEYLEAVAVARREFSAEEAEREGIPIEAPDLVLKALDECGMQDASKRIRSLVRDRAKALVESGAAGSWDSAPYLAITALGGPSGLRLTEQREAWETRKREAAEAAAPKSAGDEADFETLLANAIESGTILASAADTYRTIHAVNPEQAREMLTSAPRANPDSAPTGVVYPEDMELRAGIRIDLDTRAREILAAQGFTPDERGELSCSTDEYLRAVEQAASEFGVPASP